jgi:acyl-CoA thioesterase-1
MLRGVDPGATQANLLAICTELRRQGISVLLTGMLAAPNLGEDYGRKFNSIFPDVAKQCGASLDPFFLEGAIGRGDRMLPDGIHPNAAGIAHIVSRVEPLVQQELRRKARS